VRLHRGERRAAVLPALSLAVLVGLAGPPVRADGFWDEIRERGRAGGSASAEWAGDLGQGTTQKVEFLAEPELHFRFPLDVDLTAVGRLRADAYDRLEPGRPSLDEVSAASRRRFVGDRVDFELRELYAEASLARALVTLGKQQIVWGRADGLKVLDVVNPQSFREFILPDFDDSRIPLWAANVEVPIADWSAQLVWIPDKSYHEIPEPGALFEFETPRLVPPAPPGIPVALRDPERPHRFFQDSDAGLRLATFAGGWDLSLVYLYHYDDVPILVRRIGLVGGAPGVVVTPRYRRNHLVGASASNAIGDLTLRAELGFFTDRFLPTLDRDDADGVVRTHELSSVLGFDWYGFSDTLLSLQVFPRVLTDRPGGVYRDQVDLNLTFLVRRSFWNETLLLQGIWIGNANDGDGLVRAKVAYDLTDHVRIWAGADVFYGKAQGLFGEFDGNDRVVLGIELGV
jgi:hypothetical protein